MPVARPSPQDVAAMAGAFGMTMSAAEAADYLAEMGPSFDAYDLIDALPDPVPPPSYPRSAGVRPPPEMNPFGAWAVRSEVRGAPAGPLASKTVVLKDNVALAGVPMSNGSQTLDGYAPAFDATVVTRILDADGTVLGKAVCEHLCLSGGSHTSDSGPVHNPWRHGYTTGGSSSGCAALVRAGEADMAVGGDQGGSIRIPSAYCGIYGLKPTHGLVPYTGIMPIEATLDHAGPMTATVRDNALLLETIAGADGLDPRQACPRTARYTESLGLGVEGLRIGLLAEGFAVPGMQAGVARAVRAVADRLGALGAVVTPTSIPDHALAPAVWTPIAIEGPLVQMMLGDGMGFNWKGLYDLGLMQAHAGWRSRPDDLSKPLKLSMLTGRWGLDRHGGRFYAKAQNLARRIGAAYDEAFARFDLLLMPTVPRVASALPAPDSPLSEVNARSAELNVSTCPFDVTGHPAMSVPCALNEGLPVGMMLVARRYGEETIYRAAAAFEADGDWTRR